MQAVRAAVAEMAEALLVGPLEPDEVIESAPVDTYLTGILWPKGAPVDGVDDDAGLGAAGDDEEGAESTVPGYRAIRPCSIGITFAVTAGATVTVDLGATSRYALTEADTAPSLSGAPAAGSGEASRELQSVDAPAPSSSEAATAVTRAHRAWVRRRLGYTVTLPPESTTSTSRVNTFGDASGATVTDSRVSLHVRRRVGANQHIFTVTLINDEPDRDDAEGRDSRDARCLFQTEIRIRAEIGGQAAIEPRPLPPPDREDRDALNNALLYRNVREFAVGHGIATSWAEEAESAVHEVRTAWMPQAVVRGTSADGHALLGAFRSAWPDALRAEFLGREAERTQILDALDQFVQCYTGWIDRTLIPRAGSFGADLDRAAEDNLAACTSARDRMVDGVRVLRDDGHAWTAFAMANAAMHRQSMFLAKGKNPRPLVWRPFQLAFMLLVIPGLVDPSRDDRQCMDLLWFPTGGGKTEAYLALTAFQIFHRRLVSDSRRASGGVDVLMRYTLRLLTVQQFQRAASLISACELMRLADPRLGDARITLGLYVGGDATPNQMEKAREAIAQEQAGQEPASTPRQLLRCPVCGGELPASAWKADTAAPRLDIVCTREGCETKSRPLPVLTVDEIIYDAPPSLLIGTIDKFAQIPRRTDIRRLFALDGGDPPGLIIQDELHLISGPLGSMAGLYETVIDALCTRGDVRPKVIGSTATIGHAEDQVRSLFDRSVLQFPPPGFDAGDSFYAVRDDTGPDRIYIGLPTAGRSPKFALQALVASLLQSVAALREKGVAGDSAVDPYWTCVSYFNSLRELGGAHVLMQDDVPRQMQFLAGRLKVGKRDLQDLIVELSSRKSSRELPQLLQKLSGTLEESSDPYGDVPQPPDAVLASNMISVGVDVPRLGLMVVNGQPKSTAEYIQASSRVGRGLPGLVFTIYNFGRPRDLSHFEHFRAYHGALYRSVEATSVTPWAPRARDKALHAVVASLVRHLCAGMSDDEAAARFRADDPALAGILDIVRRRVEAATDAAEARSAAEDLAAIVDEWDRRSNEARTTGSRLRYWLRKAPFGRSAPHLMCSAEEANPTASQAWPTPNTMREVEPSTAFVLKTIPTKAGG
jgi:hypothetical protein